MSEPRTETVRPFSIPLTHNGNSCRLVMSMGNYLSLHVLLVAVMAASNQTVGVDHVTVVPENFEPEGESRREDREAEQTDWE